MRPCTIRSNVLKQKIYYWYLLIYLVVLELIECLCIRLKMANITRSVKDAFLDLPVRKIWSSLW